MTTDTQITLTDFLERYPVKMTTERTFENRNMDSDPEWERTASHWICRLRFQSRQLAIPFSQGSAHKEPPTMRDLLDCLASDASGIENANDDFEEWCGEYGYDTDSRKAERTFKACVRQAKGLRRLLGDDAYELLLWHTERD
jgi:hypothetical protein